MNFLDRFFKISERGGSVRTEFFAGLTTFAAMSYILAVNPAILSSAGVDKAGQVYITAFVAGVSTLIMGLFANRPVALAPGMGTNAYLAFFICGALGLRWQEAFALVFYNGLIFFFISLFKIREKIIEAIPHSLQLGLQCGIGAFIVFLGLKNSGIIVDDSATLTAVGDIFSANVLLASAGFVLIAVLAVFRFNFAVMFSILALTAAAFFMHDASGRALAEAPAALVSAPASIPDTVFALDFAYPFRHFWGTLPIILTLLFLDMFDSIGTIVALSRRANFYRNGRIEDVSKILVVDSAATCFGALMGTSTVSCYVESAAGIESGARTGLSSVVVAGCFFASLFFSPVICAVPGIATAPALIWVGMMMFSGVSELKGGVSETVPALFCAIIIMLSFSITEGFAFGIILFALLKLVKTPRSVPAATWVLAACMAAFLILKK